MKLHWFFAAAFLAALAVMAWAQVRPPTTAPPIRQPQAPQLLRPSLLRFPTQQLRTEIVQIVRAVEQPSPNGRYLSRDPAQVLRQNTIDRNNGILRLRTLITQAGKDGWELSEMESLGQGGVYEEVLLVFKRPAPMPN